MLIKTVFLSLIVGLSASVMAAEDVTEASKNQAPATADAAESTEPSVHDAPKAEEAAEPAVHEEKLEDIMKGMKTEFKNLKKARAIENMKPYAKALRSTILKAQKYPLPADVPESAKAKYNEGMEALAEKANELLKAIDTGKKKDVKKVMKAMNKLRKKYHKALDVK